MKIWLFSHLDSSSPGNRLFTEEAEKRGHQVTRVRPGQLHLPLQERPESVPDLIYTRIGSSAPAIALTTLQCFEHLGFRCLNESAGLLLSRDKTLTYSLLSGAGIPVPKTVLLGSGPVEPALEHLPGPPWILKLPMSTKGQGVLLVESLRSLRSAVDTLRDSGQVLLLQEFVKSAAGSDTRVLVLGGRCAVAARRTATSAGEFRSNVHLGGHPTEVELTPQLRAVAEQAAATLGLGIAGVDILESDSGPLVVEVNGSPGLQAAPGMPRLLVDHLEAYQA